MSKPREFWIADVTTQDHGELPVAFSFIKPNHHIHVIEKSAYDKLKIENFKLTEVNKALASKILDIKKSIDFTCAEVNKGWVEDGSMGHTDVFQSGAIWAASRVQKVLNK